MKFRISLLFLATLSVPATSWAHHFNRGHFVRAYRPCTVATANTTTSNGVPACSPAVLLSDCATDPTTALQMGKPGKSSLTMMPTGRRHTRADHGHPTLESRFGLSRVLRCDGTPYSGALTVEVAVRVQRNDPVCNSGICTLPDATYTHQLTCSLGNCSSSLADEAVGLAPLPVDHGYTVQVVRVSVLDLAARQFLNMGIASTDDTGSLLYASSTPRDPQWWKDSILDLLLPSDAEAYGATGTGYPKRYLARYVQAFEACDAGATDTLTGDGLAACTAVISSDCATNPQAITPITPMSGNFTDNGKGKVDMGWRRKRDRSKLSVGGAVDGIADCTGAPYTGTVGVRTSVRATVLDPACAGGNCTTVTTSFVSGTSEAKDGQLTKKALRDGTSGLYLSAGPEVVSVSAELVEAVLTDPTGAPFLFGPAFFVRCNFDAGTPNQPGGDAFCFGN